MRKNLEIKMEFLEMANRHSQETKNHIQELKRKHKKEIAIKCGLAIGLTAAIIGCCSYAHANTEPQETVYSSYTKTGTWWGTCNVVTDDGEEWEYTFDERKPLLKDGTKILVSFNTNGTSTVYDDIITSVVEMPTK